MLTSSLTAEQMMSTEVVQVDPGTSLREAMRLMLEQRVGSLPVANDENRCLGIITPRDILTAQLSEAENASPQVATEGSYYNPDTDAWESLSVCVALDDLPDRPVEDVMSDHVVFVHPQTAIAEVAEAMVGEGLHHILVIDDDNRLHGVISSLDFVRLALQTIQPE